MSININTVDVIIPTYKPGKKFLRILKALKQQTYPVSRVIVFNTQEEYWNRFVKGLNTDELPMNPEIHHISKEEFDHGKTRGAAAAISDADAFLCMTDDAVPADKHLIEKLVKALSQEVCVPVAGVADSGRGIRANQKASAVKQVAVSYARQLPGKRADVAERYARKFNYPEESYVKSEEDLQRLGIKTYFCSNVCALYNRQIYESLGGFITKTIFNEDMIYAAKAIKAGYSIAYEADAKVYHYHKYSNMQQFHRNFDLGVSQAQHPEVFADVPSEGEGIRMVKQTAGFLKENNMAYRIPGLFITSAFKYAGYLLGKNYKKLPKALVMKCTTNPKYFV